MPALSAAAAGGRRRREETVHRGIRWRRSVGGTITWLNENRGQWVTWYQGADAPPLPPAWEGQAQSPGYPVKAPPEPTGPAPGQPSSGGVGLGMARRAGGPGRAAATGGGAGAAPARGDPGAGSLQRASWRSPYRLVPILIAVGIIAVGIYQGTHATAKATPQQVAQAEALQGKCLERTGGTSQLPKLSPHPVSCSSPRAAYRVVEVLVPGAKGQAQSCRAGDAMVRVEPVAVAGEPVECVKLVKHNP